MGTHEDFSRMCSAVCEKHGWKLGDGQREIELDIGTARRQRVKVDFFEFEGRELVRLHSAIGSTRRIRAEQLVHALRLNFNLPHGSLAVRDDELVLVETLGVEGVEPAEIEAAVRFLAETADHYEQTLFGRDDN